MVPKCGACSKNVILVVLKKIVAGKKKREEDREEKRGGEYVKVREEEKGELERERKTE